MSDGLLQTKTISSRAFIVGCGRSGTSLLQVMVAGHSRVFSCPETHFFDRTYGRSQWLMRPARARRTRNVLYHIASLLGRPDFNQIVPRWSLFYGKYVPAFRTMLDTCARDAGKDMWVEKTPLHILHIPTIAKFFPDARFVHILRDGRDVVASMVEATSLDPVAWGSRFSIERCVQIWNRAVKISLSYAHNPDHMLVRYEDLIVEPVGVLNEVCHFLGIDYEPSMVNPRVGAERVYGDPGNRKPPRNIYREVFDTRLKKFPVLFSEEEQQQVEGSLWNGGRVEELVGVASSPG